MKKYIIFCLAAALCTSCAKDAEVFEPGVEDGLDVRFSGLPEDTRVSYQNTGNAFKVSWDRDDQVGIFAATEKGTYKANIPYTAARTGAATDFDPACYSERIRWIDETSKHTFYAYTPYNEQAGTDPEAVAVSIPAIQQQATNNDVSHLPALDFMYAGVTDLVKSEEPIAMNFRHAFTVLDIHIPVKENARIWLTNIDFACTSDTKELVSFENGRIDITTGKLDLASATGTNTIRLECGFATSDLEDQHLFLMVSPGHAGKTFEISSTINGTKYVLATRTAPASGLLPGEVLTVEAELPEFDEEDLYPAEDLSRNGTANCYIVNRANGYFRFRADVKGNGIARDLHYTTVNKKQAGTFGYTADELKIEPKAAVLLWYECAQFNKSKSGQWDNFCPIVLKSLTLKSNNYVYFETPADFVHGNAVIAVIDKDLKADEIEVDPETRQLTNVNILWSWNLIFSEGYDPDDAGQQIAKGGYTFMTRDLGAVVDASYSLDAYTKGASQGNVYQWGSKNPAPHIPGYDSADVPYVTHLQFTPNYSTIPALGIPDEQGQGSHTVTDQVFGSKDHTKNLCKIGNLAGDNNYSNEIAIDYATRNPHMWLNGGSGGEYAWIKNGANGVAFWGTPDGEMEVKTIFDPCPAGWKVPSMKAWNALTEDQTAAINAKDRYFDFYGVYYPIWGGRSTSGQSSGYDIQGNSGYRCSARYHSADGDDSAGYTRTVTFRIIANQGQYDQNPESGSETTVTHSAEGHRIRCVKEK